MTLPKRRPYFWAATDIPILPAATAALAAGIFILDTATGLDIAVDVLYVIVVLMAAGSCQQRGIIIVSAGCMALTVLSFFLTFTASPSTDVINDALGLVAIGATTYLVLRIKSAETATHAARAQIAHIARVTTLGELTASIAHEVNQPLAAIVTNANACLRWLAHNPPNLQEAEKAVARIVENGNRAGNIIEGVRGLAKRSSMQKEHLNINKLIHEIISLTTTEVQQNRISLRTQLADDLPLVLGDQVQLQQVLLNLILNAIEAMYSTVEGSREMLITTAKNESGDVTVAVCDSGSGLEANTLNRLFDAFYTTKRNGMGMGLAISRSIVEAHDGRIWAKPNTSRGAIFQFTLPTVREREPQLEAESIVAKA